MRKIELQDAFKLSKIIKKSGVKDDFVRIAQKFEKAKAKALEESNDDKSETSKEALESLQNDAGIEIIFTLIDTAGSVGLDTEVYELLGGISEKTPEEVKHLSIDGVVELFKKIVEENDIVNFTKTVRTLTK